MKHLLFDLDGKMNDQNNLTNMICLKVEIKLICRNNIDSNKIDVI